MAVDPLTMFLEDGTGHFTRPTGGGGGSAPVMTTMAGINALATAGALVPGTLYGVTDWVSGTGSLPGPNTLWVEADDASTPSKFVRIETPYGILGPSHGTFLWNYGGSLNIMTLLWDNLGNEVHDIESGAIDAFVWGNLTWNNNRLYSGPFTTAFSVNNAAATAGFQFANNDVRGAMQIDLTNCTGGSIAGNSVGGGATLTATTGAATANVTACNVGPGSALQVESGASVTSCDVGSVATLIVRASSDALYCRVGAQGFLDTSGFNATAVVVEGDFVVTLTADNSGTLKNAGFSNVV